LPWKPFRHVHVGWWFWARHVACSAQVSCSHTGLHLLFNLSHASWSAQSSLYWHTTDTQDTIGEPCVPAGQMQWALWDCTIQSAPWPQLRVEHGFKQLLLMHALSYTQSLSVLQPAENTKKKIHNYTEGDHLWLWLIISG